MRLTRRTTAMAAAVAAAVAGGGVVAVGGASAHTSHAPGPQPCRGTPGDKPDCIPVETDGGQAGGPGRDAGTGPGQGAGNGQSPGGGAGGGPAVAPPGRQPRDGETPGSSGGAPGNTGDLPGPAMGRRVVVEPASGTVLVRRPGTSDFVAIDEGAPLPVGSVVDASRGRITLTSAVAADGTSQTGTFWGGVFTVRQPKGGRGMTDLVLSGRLTCPGTAAGAARLAMAVETAKRAPRARRAAQRRLWGKDTKGRFRTHGRNSVATVRGTQWLTVENCRGTMTYVRHGAVVVRDKRTGRDVLVTAGERYWAKAPAPGAPTA
ncbi:hypothetical protein [Miltoncostaea marina]|uniref:hypothetical protein n=1 Tax=Miltoncostaea marina TaxID=2843215 RepID=UPI001C3E6AF2|nr:hypothetical protein [Miltoncostaea marina]